VIQNIFRLKSLDRFILKEIRGPFLFGIMAFSIIMVAGGLLFKLADLIIERGVSLGVAARLFLYYLPRLVSFTIPMSCLLASLLGFSKLSSNSELVALKSAGLSFRRIIRPVVMAAFFVSVGAFFVNETLVPLSERAAANVMMFEVLKQSPPVFKEKIFLREESGGKLRRVIYINSMDMRTNDMKDILVQEFENGRLARITSAESGKWIDGGWWMDEGSVFEIKENDEISLMFRFDRQALMLIFKPDEIKRNIDDPDQMTLPQLYTAIKILERVGLETNKLWMMLHLRVSIPWACICMAIVGAALGSRPQRSGSSVGLGLSVIIVFVYYVIMSFSRSLGEAAYLPPPVAAWIPNAAFLAVGTFLCIRANRLG